MRRLRQRFPLPLLLLLFMLVGAETGVAQQITGGGGGGSGGGVTSVASGSCLKGGPVTTTGTIAFDGAINPQTSTYQVLASDFSACKTISVASGTFTITLVASSSQPASGQFIEILNYGSGIVTVAPSGQNLNGSSSSVILGPGAASAPSSGWVQSDGTNYFGSFGSAIVASFGFAFGNPAASTALTSGSTQTAYFTVKRACKISSWDINVDAGTITFDIWISTGTAIPTAGNSITASALPALSTATAIHSTTLSGWTLPVAANSNVAININTVATTKYASLVVGCN